MRVALPVSVGSSPGFPLPPPPLTRRLAAMNLPMAMKNVTGSRIKMVDPARISEDSRTASGCLDHTQIVSQALWFKTGPDHWDKESRTLTAKNKFAILNYLTTLEERGEPANKDKTKEFLAGKPTRVKERILKWPLAANAWEFPVQVQKVVWTFVAWANTQEPYMPENMYWKQKNPRIDKGRTMTSPPGVEREFPFKLVKGFGSDAEEEEGSEAEISEDDSDEEQGAQNMNFGDNRPFKWEEFPAVKQTRQNYRNNLRTRRKGGIERALACCQHLAQGKIRSIYGMSLPLWAPPETWTLKMNGIEMSVCYIVEILNIAIYNTRVEDQQTEEEETMDSESSQ